MTECFWEESFEGLFCEKHGCHVLDCPCPRVGASMIMPLEHFTIEEA